MNPNFTVQPPARPAGYVPYFYEAGHYLWRPLSANEPSSRHADLSEFVPSLMYPCSDS